MPAGVPHAETPVDLQTPYGILVVANAKEGSVLLRTSANASRQIVGYGMTRFCGGGYAFRFLDYAARHLSIHQTLRKRYVEGAIEAFLAAILTEVMRPGGVHPHDGSPLVAEAEKIVRLRISESEMTVTSIADRLNCSRDYLTRLFRAERGMTLNVWIARERVQLACDLLAMPGHNIAEVGWSCGFASPSYFIRVFRAHTGFTPRAWRMGKGMMGDG